MQSWLIFLYFLCDIWSENDFDIKNRNNMTCCTWLRENVKRWCRPWTVLAITSSEPSRNQCIISIVILKHPLWMITQTHIDTFSCLLKVFIGNRTTVQTYLHDPCLIRQLFWWKKITSVNWFKYWFQTLKNSSKI